MIQQERSFWAWRRILIILTLLGCGVIGSLLGQGFTSALIILAAIAFLVIGFAAPQLLLLLVAGVWPIYWIPGFSAIVVLDAKDILLIVFIVSVIVRAFVIERASLKQLVETPASRILLLLILVTLTGVVFSPTPNTSLLVWIRFVVAFFLYWCLRYVFLSFSKTALILPRLLVLPVLFLVIYVVLAKLGFFSPFVPPSEYSLIKDYAVAAFSYRELALSYSIAFVIPIVVVLLLKGSKDRLLLKGLWGSALIVMFVVLILTEGRGGLLASLLGLLITVHFIYAEKQGFVKTAILVAVVLVLIMTLKSVPDVFMGGVKLTELTGVGLDITNSRWGTFSSGRSLQWVASLDTIRHYPITGIGLGNFGKIESVQGTLGTDSHNLILGLAAEAGLASALVGLVFFVYILVTYARVARYLSQETSHAFAPAFYGILIAYATQAMLDIGAMFFNTYLGILFWIAIVYLDVMGRNARSGQVSLAPE